MVSFANVLLVMTSNVGSAVIAKGGGSLGFQLAGGNDADGGAYSRISSLVKEELKARIGLILLHWDCDSFFAKTLQNDF